MGPPGELLLLLVEGRTTGNMICVLSGGERMGVDGVEELLLQLLVPRTTGELSGLSPCACC